MCFNVAGDGPDHELKMRGDPLNQVNSVGRPTRDLLHTLHVDDVVSVLNIVYYYFMLSSAH